MKKIFTAFALFLGLAVACFGQTAAPTQHFVISGSASGQPASISSMGIQVTKSVSLAYEFIVNPNDSSKPRYGSGVANYTVGADYFLPKSLKSKLLIDPSNYLITFQAGAGRESLAGAKVGAPRVSHIIGNFGIYGGKPVAPHAQLGVGYKFIVGPHSQLIKVPVGTLNFTF